MLRGLTAILIFQLAGELVSAGTGIPLPGPVIGMALLFAAMAARGGVQKDVGLVADGLLRHLSLLFVPAGTGIMLHAGVLRNEALPILATLLLSTLATIAATALAMRFLSRKTGG